MTKVTLLKSYRNTETLRVVDLQTLVEDIKTQVYHPEVKELRDIYPLLKLERTDDGSVSGAEDCTRKIPRICFATLLENRNHQRVNKGYTGVVLLEVNNLQSYEEAAAIRTGAGLMPLTLLAFVGASGRSVKIVVRGEMQEVSVEQSEDEIRQFHYNLYEKARMAYNVQLGVTIEKLEPFLDRTCYMSIDGHSVLHRPLSNEPACRPHRFSQCRF